MKKLVGLSILSVFLFATPLSAGLNEFNYRIIRLAFINGYIRALQSDLEKIRFVKNNAREMQEYITLEADKYMMEVARMNVKIKKEEEKPSEANKPMRLW